MKNILILFGGQSTEHEISCLSAASVLRNIDRDKFNVTAVGITKDGDWFPCDSEKDIDVIEKCEYQNLVCGKGLMPALSYLYKADIVFPVMHGIMAEDGTVQGLLSLLEKPFVGPGVLGSALCMDKVYTKIILENAGIPQVKSITLMRGEIEKKMSEIENKLGYPCFVKPSNSGSSVGCFKAENRDELLAAVANAEQFDRKVLVEEFVDCQEVECAVLGNENPIASTPGEIVSESEFYDYDDKYINGTSSTCIPANIPVRDLETIKKLAVKAFKACDLAGLSRIDFFREKETGKIYLNEINTIPGFTSISMYGKMWAHDGLSYKDLITRLLELAEDAFEANKRKDARD